MRGFGGYLIRVLGDHFVKVDEERIRIVGTGRSFGVVLDRKDRTVFQTKAFHGVIIQIDFRYDGTRFLQFFACRGETVILCGD